MIRREFMARVASGLTVFNGAALDALHAANRSVLSHTPDDVTQDEDYWLQIRRAFTVDENYVNLNSGSVSPAPRTVQQAMQGYLEMMNASPSYHVDTYLHPMRDGVRARLARAFHCDAEEIAITRGTTDGMEAVQFGLKLQAGDEVITTTQDYPSMLTAWRQRERRDGIKLKLVSFSTPPASMDDLSRRIEAAITPRTRIIMVCHVTYTTGQIFPIRQLADLARARGVELVVDGGHAFAQFPYDGGALGCDYYASSLHKWLTAPVGTGLLFVRREKIPQVWSLTASPEALNGDIRKFEQTGTHPVANWLAIAEALTFHEAIGAERKAERLRFLRDRWAKRVAPLDRVTVHTPLDPAQSCGIGSMSIRGIGADELVQLLWDRGRIHVRARHVENEFSCIRVTPNVFSTLEEVDRFSAAIEVAVRDGVGKK